MTASCSRFPSMPPPVPLLAADLLDVARRSLKTSSNWRNSARRSCQASRRICSELADAGACTRWKTVQRRQIRLLIQRCKAGDRLLRELPNRCRARSLRGIRSHSRRCSQVGQRDSFSYCPFAYTYNNYARRGFAKNVLRFGNLVSLAAIRCEASLGNRHRHQQDMPEYRGGDRFHADVRIGPRAGRDLCFPRAVSPRGREAWEDATANAIAGNFFAMFAAHNPNRLSARDTTAMSRSRNPPACRSSSVVFTTRFRPRMHWK